MNFAVVGIGGVSNGGKTTLANNLAELLRKKGIEVHVMHQDFYFKEEKDVPYDHEGGYSRWDELAAFDMDKMMKDVEKIIEDVSRVAQEQRSVLIVEGILIFNYRRLNRLFDSRYFLQLDKQEARKRRLERTYAPPDTDNLFDDHVWPMYLKHLAQLQENKIPVAKLNGTTSPEELLATVSSEVIALLSKEANGNLQSINS